MMAAYPLLEFIIERFAVFQVIDDDPPYLRRRQFLFLPFLFQELFFLVTYARQLFPDPVPVWFFSPRCSSLSGPPSLLLSFPGIEIRKSIFYSKGSHCSSLLAWEKSCSSIISFRSSPVSRWSRTKPMDSATAFRQVHDPRWQPMPEIAFMVSLGSSPDLKSQGKKGGDSVRQGGAAPPRLAETDEDIYRCIRLGRDVYGGEDLAAV